MLSVIAPGVRRGIAVFSAAAALAGPAVDAEWGIDQIQTAQAWADSGPYVSRY